MTSGLNIAGLSCPSLSATTPPPSKMSFPVGDARTWSVTILKDLTGWGGEWRLGTPDMGALPRRLPQSSSIAEVLVRKTRAAGSLAIAVNSDGSSTLTWTTLAADTAAIPPGVYCFQAIVIDPQGNPFTVRDGLVTLGASLRATDLQPA